MLEVQVKKLEAKKLFKVHLVIPIYPCAAIFDRICVQATRLVTRAAICGNAPIF